MNIENFKIEWVVFVKESFVSVKVIDTVYIDNAPNFIIPSIGDIIELSDGKEIKKYIVTKRFIEYSKNKIHIYIRQK